MHTPVLLHEVLSYLAVSKDGVYIDATAGEGGHLFPIAKASKKVLGIDRDTKQIEALSQKVEEQHMNDRIQLVVGSYADIQHIAETNGFAEVDGILFDLGLSYRQLQEGNRGFSYKKTNEQLDMRLDDVSEELASDIVNRYTPEELFTVLARYSEEPSSQKITDLIIQTRNRHKIQTVGDLTRIIDMAVGYSDTGIYARIFQALRIETNNEFDQIRKGLEGAVPLVKKGGHIVIISFHSGEDRIVKEFIRSHHLEAATKHTVKGDREKRFERSAQLRIINL